MRKAGGFFDSDDPGKIISVVLRAPVYSRPSALRAAMLLRSPDSIAR